MSPTQLGGIEVRAGGRTDARNGHHLRTHVEGSMLASLSSRISFRKWSIAKAF
jgi:hypothetical protein